MILTALSSTAHSAVAAVTAVTPVTAASDFAAPRVDYHALAPEIVLAAGLIAFVVALVGFRRAFMRRSGGVGFRA